jgi:hypothetical protein
MSNPINNTGFSLKETLKENGLILGIGIYLIVMAYYLTKDPDALFTKKYLYIALTIIPMFIGLASYFKSVKPGDSIDIKKPIYIILGVLVAYFIIDKFFGAVLNTFFITSLLQLIVILIIVVALAIYYKLAYNQLYKLETTTGIVANIIFYIPCLLLNLMEYISNDLKQAPKAVYWLLVLEAILIGLYVGIPKLMKSVTKNASIKDGTPVVMEPVRLDNANNVASYVELQTSISGRPVNPGDIINNKFSLSAWVYVIPLSPNTVPYNNDAVVYEYKDYHPALMYNGSTGKFKCYFNRSSSHEFTMPMQKWNHVVTNYTKSGVDLFVNGELVHSAPRDAQNEGLTIGDIIVIGQDNGLSGGVCNMVYFSRPLLKPEIESIYSLNKDGDPPVPI